MKCFINMTFKTWNVWETWRSKINEMFQKYDVQNMKCFKNVTFQIWNVLVNWSLKHEVFRKPNVSEMWHWKYKIFQRCDVPNMKCFRNMTFKIWKCFRKVKFKIWNVLETYCSKHEMFQQRDVQYNMKYTNVPKQRHEMLKNKQIL